VVFAVISTVVSGKDKLFTWSDGDFSHKERHSREEYLFGFRVLLHVLIEVYFMYIQTTRITKGLT